MKPTDGQRHWMTIYIADGLRQLGLAVTPATMERELQRMDSLLTLSAHEYAPPDPYKLPSRVVCDDAAESDVPPDPYKLPKPGAASSTRLEPLLHTDPPPDPYAIGLARLRSPRRRP